MLARQTVEEGREPKVMVAKEKHGVGAGALDVDEELDGATCVGATVHIVAQKHNQILGKRRAQPLLKLIPAKEGEIRNMQSIIASGSGNEQYEVVNDDDDG